MDETRQLPGIPLTTTPPSRFGGRFPVRFRGDDPERVLVAVGVALVATVAVLSAFYSRQRQDLDWSNYTMGLLATLGLLGVAAVGWLYARDRDASTDLVAWPGAFGAVSAGLMIGVALDDSDATTYVAGLAVVALSAGGYLLVRRDAFVTTAIAGLFVTYLQLCDDLFDLGDGGDNVAMAISALLLVFTVVVTVAGWWLPSRVLSGVLVGIVAVVGNAVVLYALGVVATFQAAFSGLENGGGVEAKRFEGYDNDVWVILVFALLLIAGWGVAAYLTGHVGFRLLIVAMSVSVVPIATLALAVRHPTWWEVVAGGLGGLLLVAVALSAHDRSRAGASTPPPAI
ncbi:MAG: hypothetical protein JWO76_3398 [Nocardioides sp.]|nr:hypothetical protein [Nocardioides sp.]